MSAAPSIEWTSTTATAGGAAGLRFYLGAHQPHWLARPDLDVPLFVSVRTLRARRSGRLPARLPVARTGWALDSGAFTELATHGTWTITARQYAAEVRRCAAEIGQLAWAAPMDWMCEPFILARTGLTVAQHQARTTDGYRTLVDFAPDLPFIPVLQGWSLDDYRRHLDAYHAAGVDLTAAPLVGLGSVCRRQATAQITQLVTSLAALGLQLHGFGVKTTGLGRYADLLASADSLAWSYQARREPPLPGCHHGKHGLGNCANCPRYALAWRTRVLRAAAAGARQPRLVGLELAGVRPPTAPLPAPAPTDHHPPVPKEAAS